jgi:hypothetical protein
LSIDSSSTSVCSISGGEVTFNAVGTCTIDAHQSGTPNWSAATQVTQSVTVYSPLRPTVTALGRTSGPGAGGTKVKISGTGLKGATAVSFGLTPATSFTVNRKGTVITAYSPSESAGTVDIMVTTANGTSAKNSADQFTFLGPVVTAVTPTSGTHAGGTKVKISGTGLKGATAVTFGLTPATSFTVNRKGTVITAYSPSEGAGTVDITVTTPGGTSAKTSADHFAFT